MLINSNPTKIDNRFFPIEKLLSNVFLGVKDGKQFRSEGTLLKTKKIAWNGKARLSAPVRI